MELMLIRHPRTTADTDVCVGQLDVAAAPGWEAHADRLVKVLGRPDRVIASPLIRAAALGRVLADRHRVTLELDARLMELHFGRWEGRRWSEIDRTESDPWAEDYLHRAPPGGESYQTLLDRIASLLGELSGTETRIALVAHAGPIRAVLTQCLGLDPSSGWRFDIGHGRLTRLIERENIWRLDLLNA